ncbi:MAG: ABC transporter permease [Treponema sp.]|jgi:erythritol transport system permease protein|nr:ABC transporter permease [Treponema sp.]
MSADKLKQLNVADAAMKLRAYIALAVLLVFFSLNSPNFLTLTSLITMVRHISLNAIIAIGATFVILTGGIDLSIGAIIGFAGMIAGGLIHQGIPLNFLGITVYPWVPVILIVCVVIGILIGWVNGVLISKFNVTAFIATLGTMYIFRGFALLRSNGTTFPNLQGKPELRNTGFPLLGQGAFLGIPYSILIMIALVIVAVYIARKTPFGRHVYAVGGNENAARLSGIQVKKIKTIVYMISGGCAALVGLIISSELVAAHPATGETYEMNAIAATVLGGTSLAGGRGTIGGAVLGAFVIGVLNDGMVMMGISSFWQTVIRGIVIILAVILDQLQNRGPGRSNVRKAAKTNNK